MFLKKPILILKYKQLFQFLNCYSLKKKTITVFSSVRGKQCVINYNNLLWRKIRFLQNAVVIIHVNKFLDVI